MNASKWTGPARHNVSTDRILNMVADYFHLEVSALTSKRLTRETAFPRQVAMYLCRTLADESVREIGRHFGVTDHRIVIHAVHLVADRTKHDPLSRAAVESLGNVIRGWH